MKKSVYSLVNDSLVEELKRICGEEFVIFDDDALLRRYSHDKVPEDKYARSPEVVVKPRTAQEVASILKLANRERIPVTPRGAGSGLSGGAVPIFGGILLSIERMNQILEIDTENLMAVVEPGVVTNRLDSALKAHGLFFAGYPMSEEFCFIGGNVAENAGGGRAIKYGVTGRYVHGLEVVTPEGEIMQIGGKRVKDVTGYDLVHLMVGSEGTLGIFTKIILRLLPRPTDRRALLVLFEDPESAISIVPKIITLGKLVPTAIEFMDAYTFALGGKALKESFPYERIGAALLFEVDGTHPEIVKEEADTIVRICNENGAIGVYPAESDEEIERLWRIRKRIPWEILRRSTRQSIEDIVVPIASIPKAMSELKKIGQRYGVRIPVLGHAGDGNLHAIPMQNPDPQQDRWEEMLPLLLRDIYVMTDSLGGTISGEHGIGHKRSEFMGLVMSDAQIDMMRRIKLAFDPNDILNPGKIIRPAEEG